MVKIIVKSGLIVLFGMCLLKMPYSYFQLVRFAGLAGFAWLAYKDSFKTDKSLMILWAVSALLINPIFKVPLGRHVWNIVDVVWVAILLVTVLFEENANRRKIIRKDESQKVELPTVSPRAKELLEKEYGVKMTDKEAQVKVARIQDFLKNGKHERGSEDIVE